jgi:putative Ca2+/H+ antiporter (TMEM165/GDT1 family)
MGFPFSFESAMDWKVFSGSFVLIFLAELGDKTQLTAMGLSATADRQSTAAILLGSVLVISCATVLGVAAGRLLGTWLNPDYLRIGGGLLFLVYGVLMLLDKLPG